ncbi:putative integrase [alpha proteobacterium BAL199]|nr:putative integrase [alpha proteobacterium BAL199]
MVDAYRRSSAFTKLAPRTKRDYHQVLDYLRKPLGAADVDGISTPELATLIDRIAEKRNWRFANYCLAVISRVFSIGILRGKAKVNPATGVPKLTRPREAPAANRPWTDHEIEVVLAAAPAGVALAVGLGAYAGLREGDAIALPMSAYSKVGRRAAITFRPGKTHRADEDPLVLPVHPRLVQLIDNRKAGDSTVMVLGMRGRPYTSDGFRTMLFRVIAQLEAAGKVGEGLTFHGLRHTVATKLSDLGADNETIADVLGWSSTAMAKRYTKTRDRTKRAAAGLRQIK